MDKSRYTQIGQQLTLAGYFLLLIGLFCWHLFISPPPPRLISVIILVQIGPLMFPLRGLLNGKLYTHSWSMYLAIFYFIVGVWYASEASSLFFGLYIVITSLLFFVGTVIYVRYKGKQLSLDKKQSKNSPK